MLNCNAIMTEQFDGGHTVLAGLLARQNLTPADVGFLKRELSGDKILDRAEAEALFTLECAPNAKCPEWTEFFVEAITDYVIWQMRPTGVVHTPQAEWLLQQADRAKSITALAVLVNVLAEAHHVPVWLEAAVRGRAQAGWPGVDEALRAARLEHAQAA